MRVEGVSPGLDGFEGGVADVHAANGAGWDELGVVEGVDAVVADPAAVLEGFHYTIAGSKSPTYPTTLHKVA